MSDHAPTDERGPSLVGMTVTLDSFHGLIERVVVAEYPDVVAVCTVEEIARARSEGASRTRSASGRRTSSDDPRL